jgi:hypothetical protein
MQKEFIKPTDQGGCGRDEKKPSKELTSRLRKERFLVFWVPMVLGRPLSCQFSAHYSFLTVGSFKFLGSMF